MKAKASMAEQYLLNTALIMVLVLCGFSLIENGGGVVAARNAVFLLCGVSGLFVSTRMDECHRWRISKKCQRTVRLAQGLLSMFSLVAVTYVLIELGLIASLSRWD